MHATFVIGMLLQSSTVAHAADSWPSKPVRMVVPYAPGGPVDLIARPMAQRLTEALKQTVVIDNRAGANGNIGAELVAKSPADGYTLLMGSKSQLTINPLIYGRSGFDPARALAPISLIASSPSGLMVHPSLPVKSLKEFTALVRARPGKLSYASAGNGSANHLAAELYKMLAKVDLLHVPFKGGGPALNAVVGGQIEVIFISLPLTVPFVKSGRLRALAVCADKRAAVMPEVPTTAEAGLPGHESSAGVGLLGPVGMPREIVARLHAETVKALAQPDTRDKLVAQGQEVIGSTPEQFVAVIHEETERWAKVVKAANVKVD
ncbi:MAG: tripartite tricarboxylate transporter substrate binding protein [Betaproteobacteria bacterium]|nr:MAG: tripartite tricarboxylate transporter substrate binding protein [Betaproteobacteria bacterium]